MKNQYREITLHADTDLFGECLKFTSGKKGFRAALIEKDYFCSLLLAYLFSEDTKLVLKGGTSLQKIYTGFYRLSEALDFSMPVSRNISRKQRSRLAEPLKNLIQDIPSPLPVFSVASELQGYNNSTQYIARLEYRSCLTGQPETIKLEVGLREPLLDTKTEQSARTLLLNPFTGKSVVPPITVSCLSKKETYAEKIRAALTRRTPAIRDFFDIYSAKQTNTVDFTDNVLLQFAQQKIALSGEHCTESSDAMLRELLQQLETELRPVLRKEDFDTFDLEAAFSLVREIDKRLESSHKKNDRDFT